MKPGHQKTQIPAHSMIHDWRWDGVTKVQSDSAKLWWDPCCLVPASSSCRRGRHVVFLLPCSLLPHTFFAEGLSSPPAYVSRRRTPASVSVGRERSWPIMLLAYPSLDGEGDRAHISSCASIKYNTAFPVESWTQAEDVTQWPWNPPGFIDLSGAQQLNESSFTFSTSWSSRLVTFQVEMFFKTWQEA